MLDYIWIKGDIPILNQLPNNFKSAAILLHPFVQMPLGWTQLQRKDSSEHIYPDAEEILTEGKPVLWEKVMHDYNFNSLKDIELALRTSIGAFRKEYARKDLVQKLSLKPDLYFPYEDFISVLLIEDMLKVLSSKGSNSIYFSDPIYGKSGVLNINETSALDIYEITSSELIITDEYNDFAFMSIFDSFNTLFIAKDENIEDVVKLMNWEAIICNHETKIDWYM